MNMKYSMEAVWRELYKLEEGGCGEKTIDTCQYSPDGQGKNYKKNLYQILDLMLIDKDEWQDLKENVEKKPFQNMKDDFEQFQFSEDEKDFIIWLIHNWKKNRDFKKAFKLYSFEDTFAPFYTELDNVLATNDMILT